jgi:hypothetical protein
LGIFELALSSSIKESIRLFAVSIPAAEQKELAYKKDALCNTKSKQLLKDKRHSKRLQFFMVTDLSFATVSL